MSTKKLNEQQQQAVDSDELKILCLAGAGAGKTATMIERITRLTNEGVNPMSILVLTFTNAAGFEMKERYKNANPGKVIPEFRTFHSFCYSLIVKDKNVRGALGYVDVPTIIEEVELKKVETEAKMMSGVHLSEAKLRGEGTLSQQEQYELELYKKALKRLIREKNIITFDMLCYDVSGLFIKNDPSVLKYKGQYKYLFVDEFQDTDPKQIQFLNSFDSKDVHFYFVGDCLQNIYKFRGCSNDTIKALAKDDSWQKIKLFQNYRSTTQICDFANRMSTYAEDEYRIEMNGQRDGEKVTVIGGANSDFRHIIDEDHLDILVEDLMSSEEDRIENKRDVAILCRSNREVEYLCNALDAENISYFTGKRNLEAMHILKSVQDNEYMLDWLATFLNAEKYGEYIRLAAQEENPNITWFAKVYGHLPQINGRGKKIVEIRKILKDVTKPTLTKATDIAQLLDVAKEDFFFEDIPDSDEDIIPFIKEQLEVANESDIYVGTIHSSKGLEYDTVYVMGVNDKAFPLNKGEEQMNLYYVAITRAKNHLTIFKR